MPKWIFQKTSGDQQGEYQFVKKSEEGGVSRLHQNPWIFPCSIYFSSAFRVIHKDEEFIKQIFICS